MFLYDNLRNVTYYWECINLNCWPDTQKKVEMFISVLNLDWNNVV